MADFNSSLSSFIKNEVKEEASEETYAAEDDIEIKDEPKYAETLNEPFFEKNYLPADTNQVKLLLISPSITDSCNTDVLLSRVKSEKDNCTVMEILQSDDCIVNSTGRLEETTISSQNDSFQTLSNIPLITENIFSGDVTPNMNKPTLEVIHKTDRGLHSILGEELTMISVSDTLREASLGIGAPKYNNKQKIHNKYLKKSSAKERPALCPFCFNDVITHFPRHLLRHHKNREEVKKIKELGPKNQKRIELIKTLRKQGYFHLKLERNISNPVRNSKNPNAIYAVCEYCLGYYLKSLLHKHVKQCKSKPADVLKPGQKCLSNSQTFMASMTIKNDAILRSLRIREEVFQSMIADDISLTAKSDLLICLYGEALLSKHSRSAISSKIREMARMLITLRSINPNISNLFDALKPDYFSCFVAATKSISGYDTKKNSFRAPSVGVHMGTNLKIVCNVAYKVIIERKMLPTITWDHFEAKKQEIKDLKELIEGYWCKEISSLALKTIKERKEEKSILPLLAGDILLFQNHIYEQAEIAYKNLIYDINDPKQYENLTKYILAHTIMFNRKRAGAVQYLTIETYTRELHNTEQEALLIQSLTEVEKILSQQFKRVVSGEKGCEPVAIFLNKKMQTYINYLLRIRKMNTIVPKSNPYLFAIPGSEKQCMAGAIVVNKLAKNCGAERPTLLPSRKFRKHVATTLQLMAMEPDEMGQLATFMGHTKEIPIEFYRLPDDIYQTAKVAKVLLLLEKGKGTSFKGKTINDIQLEKYLSYSSDSSEDEDEGNNNMVFIKNCKSKTITKLLKRSVLSSKYDTESVAGDNVDPESRQNIKKRQLNTQTKKILGRVRWTSKEKHVVKKYFTKHIQNKITPRKQECSQFLVIHGKELQNKDWVKVKTLVYNTFR